MFGRIHYIEPLRDLKSDRSQQIREAAALKPVVINEALAGFESLLARELGYTGVAVEACKGQTNALVMAAAAQKFRLFLCVQDLTGPGASLIQSAGLAAHIPTVRHPPRSGWLDKLGRLKGGRLEVEASR